MEVLNAKLSISCTPQTHKSRPFCHLVDDTTVLAGINQKCRMQDILKTLQTLRKEGTPG